MTLESFPPKSRVQCCATCRHWGVRRGARRWCPVLALELPLPLTGCGCAAWVKEKHERFALGVYAEIETELSRQDSTTTS